MTQKSRVLSMLTIAGEAGVTTQEFLKAYIPRFSARINELRNEGYDIQTKSYRGTCKRYELHQAPVFPERQLNDNSYQLSIGGV
jgi:hypothetical protein